MEDLDLVEEEIARLVDACDKMCDTLAGSKASTFDLLRETERLTVELDANRRRQELVGSFLGTYQLLPEEVTALQGDVISEEFFAALRHVQEIHANCKSLLRTHHQRAGLELMDVMAGYQEAAYEKLCRWVQEEFHTMSDDDAPEPHELLGNAALALQERPILFKYCAEEIANMCHNALFRRFISALTRGGPAGHPKPIEMHAHDPQRYVGDMLAWLHQALAAEKDIVSAFFRDKEGAIKTNLPVSYEVSLDKIFEGVCRPFKVRVEQVLSSNTHMVDVFKLVDLLGSYMEMLQGSIGEDSLLAQTIIECQELAEKSFFDQLNGSMAKILRNPPVPPRDLSPPQVAKDVLQQMSEVVQTSSSMRSKGAQTAGLDRLVDGFLVPLGEVCEKSASRLDDDNQSKTLGHSATYCVYLINCRSTMLSALTGHPALRKSASAVSETLEKLSSTLVDREVGDVLRDCGAYELVQRIRVHHEQSSERDVSRDPALASDVLVQVLDRLFSHFASQQQTLPEFQAVHSPSLRSDLVRRVATEFEGAYKLIHGSIDPSYAQVESVRTPAQFRTLLGGLAMEDGFGGAAAGAANVTAGHPFDTVKVRMQTAERGAFRNAWHCAQHILRHEGVTKGLYRGLLPPLVGGALETGINYCIIQSLLHRFEGWNAAGSSNAIVGNAQGTEEHHSTDEDDHAPSSSWSNTSTLAPLAMASAFSGMCISFVLSPFELIKCRLQAGYARSTAECLRLTVQGEGYKGLARGVTGTLAREIPGNAIFFTAYEALRTASPRTESPVHEFFSSILCGGTAGVLMWSSIFPIDLAKSRVQTAIPGTSLYNFGLLQHARRALQIGGTRALYAGFSTTVVRAFPANAAQWLVWEMAMRHVRN